MTSEQLLIVNKVCKKVSKKFTFSIYDEDDIYQEAYILALDIMERYWDGERSLENFLLISVSNKLRSLIKSKIGSNSEYFKDRKKNLESAININKVYEYELPSYLFAHEDIDNKLFLEKIEAKLPIDLRKDYLKLKSGVYLQTHRKELIISTIKNLYIEDLLPLAFEVKSISKYTDKYCIEIIQIMNFDKGIFAQIPGGYLVEYKDEV